MVEKPTKLHAAPVITGIARKQERSPFLKKVLIIDDDPDITLAFKLGLDSYYYYYENRRRFEVYTQ